MSRNYPRLNILDFGNQLLDSGDLDPIYVALRAAQDDNQMTRDHVSRWMIAYWCFYHAGLASYLSEFQGSSFWEVVAEAVINETPSPVGGRWPRGKERRHFRGLNGIESVTDLATKYPTRPEAMLDACTTLSNYCAGDVMDRVQSHVGFGPWIAWKVTDMMERIQGIPISFEGFNLSMYQEPAEAARMLFEQVVVGHEVMDVENGADVNWAVAYLIYHFGHRTAPPTHDRKVNIQEIETILCKWKSHQGGHYPLNNDLHEIRDGFKTWHICETATIFLQFFPHAPNQHTG